MKVECSSDIIGKKESEIEINKPKYQLKEITQYLDGKLPDGYYINQRPYAWACGIQPEFEIIKGVYDVFFTFPVVIINIVDKIIDIKYTGKELFDFCYTFGELFNFNKIIKHYE